MDKIAQTGTIRMQMMSKMMDHNKGDKEAMIKMCEMMKDNPGDAQNDDDTRRKDDGMRNDFLIK